MLKLTIQYMASMNYFLILSTNMNTARIPSVGYTPPPPLFQKNKTENIRYKNYSTQTDKLMVNQLVGYVQMMNMQYFAQLTPRAYNWCSGRPPDTGLCFRILPACPSNSKPRIRLYKHLILSSYLP